MRPVTASPNSTTPSRADVVQGGDRSALYDVLVGEAVYDHAGKGGSEPRFANADPVPEDHWHGVSIACGYLGLVAGFGAVAAAIW